MTQGATDTDLAKLGAYLQAVADAVDGLRSIRSAEVLHGKFKIADLNKIKFAAPAAFVSVVLAKPQIQHAGQIRLECEFAIMLVTKTADHRQEPFALSLECLNLVHRNVFGFTGISQPAGFDILPILTGDERGKGHALTALTWKQTLKVIDTPRPARELDQVAHKDGTVIYDRQASGDST